MGNHKKKSLKNCFLLNVFLQTLHYVSTMSSNSLWPMDSSLCIMSFNSSNDVIRKSLLLCPFSEKETEHRVDIQPPLARQKNPRTVALRPELQCLAIMSQVWERPWLPTRIINRWLPHSFRASKHTGHIRNIYSNPIYFCCYWFVSSALGIDPRTCHVTGKCPSTDILERFSLFMLRLSL